MNEEIQRIEERLAVLRVDYVNASPNRKRFIVILANSLKDKQKRLRERDIIQV
jgi:hypothetical protein